MYQNTNRNLDDKYLRTRSSAISNVETMAATTSLEALAGLHSPGSQSTDLSCPTSGKRLSKKYIALLNALCHADKEQRVALIRAADKNFINCICECVLNVLQGVIELKPKEKKRLGKHKSVLRKLIATPRNSIRSSEGAWRNRKRTLVQSGGSFLPIVLAPLLGSIFSKIIGS